MSLWRRLLSYLLPYKRLLLAALVAMVILACTTGLYPLLIDLLSTVLFGGEDALDRLLSPRLAQLAAVLAHVGITLDAEDVRRSLATHLFVVFGVVVLAKAASQAVRFYAMGAVAQRVIHDLRHQIFAAISRQSAVFFGAEATGFLVSRVVNDVGHVERAATYAIPVMVGDALKVLVLAGVCLWQYPDLALVTLVVLPLAAFPIVRFGRWLKIYARESQEALASLTNRLTETLGGIRVVQIHGREDHEVDRFDAESGRYVDTMMKSVLVRALQTPVMELVGVGALLLTMVLAQWRIDSGAIRPGQVIGFVLALVLMYEPLKAIGRLNGIIMPGIAAAERVFDIVDRPRAVVDAPGAIELPPMEKSLVFEDVGFRYREAEKFALEHLDFALSRGRVTALVGSSGSGKSTVAALVPRLYDPTSGRITIDGVPIAEATLVSLRRQLAIVTQETYLFNDTIRANICYGRPDASDEDVRAAAKSAFAADFIEALENGFDTVVGERGTILSGGQRQRIAIARAFLRDAPILILDEATSALDSESEREVQRAIDALLEHRTALVIAHRLSTIRHADEIVVLDEGRIVERGTHDSLISRAGVYSRLVHVAGGPSVSGNSQCA